MSWGLHTFLENGQSIFPNNAQQIPSALLCNFLELEILLGGNCMSRGGRLRTKSLFSYVVSVCTIIGRGRRSKEEEEDIK